MRGIIFLTFCLLLVVSFVSAETTQEINLKDSEVIAVDLGPIPKGLKVPAKPSADWLVLFLTVGYESYELPDDPTFTCWEPIDTYFRDNNVYFGTVVANFDSVAHNIPLKWEITGSKNLIANVRRNAPPLRVTAYFIIKKLVNDVGIYQIKVKMFQPGGGFPAPGKLLDEMIARFVINNYIG